MYEYTILEMSGTGANMAQTWSRDHAKPYIYTKYLNIEVMVSIPQNGLYGRYDEIGILTKLTRLLFVILDLKSSIPEHWIQMPLRYDPKGTESTILSLFLCMPYQWYVSNHYRAHDFQQVGM